MKGMAGSEPQGGRARFSPREEQVLALWDEGLSDKEIAQRLGIRVKSVQNLGQQIRSKLNADSRGKAAAEWRKLQRGSESLQSDVVPARSSPVPHTLATRGEHRWLSRRRFLGLAVGSGLAVGVVGSAGWLWTHRQSSTSEGGHGTPFVTYHGHSDEVIALAWSPSSDHIASGSRDTTIHVWNVRNGQLVSKYQHHANTVNAVAWSPTGALIASGSGQVHKGVNPEYTARVWHWNSGTDVSTYRNHRDSIHSVSWSQDGQRVASGSTDHTLQVWEAATARPQFQLSDPSLRHVIVLSVAWSPDGARIASGDRAHLVEIWDVEKRSLVYAFQQHERDVNAVAWSPRDSGYILSGADDRKVIVWEAQTGVVRFVQTHLEAVTSVAWAPDGRHVVSGSRDRTARVWDAISGNLVCIYDRHANGVYAVAWSPNGRFIASASSDHTVHVWRPSVAGL